MAKKPDKTASIGLASLRRTNREKMEMADHRPKPEELEDFGWGLTISLGHAELQKLGLAREGVDAGSFVAVVATGRVVTNSVEMINGMARRSMVVQLQNMQIEPMEEAPKDIAELIYGGKVARS